MQILLQNHSAYKIGIAFLHSLPLPTLHSYPALVTVIPNIIRLKEETAVPKKCAPSVLISTGSHETAGSEMVRWEENTGKICVNPSLHLVLISENLSRCEMIDLFAGDCCEAAVSNLGHQGNAYGTWALFLLSGPSPTYPVSRVPSLSGASLKMSCLSPLLFRIQYNAQSWVELKMVSLFTIWHHCSRRLVHIHSPSSHNNPMR